MTERNYAIDFIRLVAILGVVIIHVSTAFTDRIPYFSGEFYTVHFLNQFARFSVPLFFAISGFLLASRYFDIKSPILFYKKRLSKIFLPYILWSLIYFLIVFPSPIIELFSSEFLYDIYSGKASYQLYFIPAIIILYAAFPFFVHYKKIFLNKWTLLSMLIIETLILSRVYFDHIIPPFTPPFNVAFYNLLPFIIGVYAGIHKVDILKEVKQNIILIMITFTTLLIWIIAESFYMFSISENGSYLRDQWRISIMLYGVISAALFYFIYDKFLRRFQNLISYLSRFSFGIFFIHVAILHYLLFVIDRHELFGTLWFVVSFFSVTFFSLLISIIISKSKFIGKILGVTN